MLRVGLGIGEQGVCLHASGRSGGPRWTMFGIGLGICHGVGRLKASRVGNRTGRAMLGIRHGVGQSECVNADGGRHSVVLQDARLR